MKRKTLSLGFALTLGFLASFAGGPQPAAEAAACPSNYCSAGRQSCLQGCPCATFYCDPVACWSDCSCPIFCLD